jgi:hypothetical protein
VSPFSYDADPIVDELLGLITVPDSFTKSAADAPPPVYRGNTLYAWLVRQEARSVQMDGGLHPEMWFFIRLAYAVGTGEAIGSVRNKTTTDAIDAGMAAIVEAVVSNPVSDLWEGIQVDQMDPNAATTFDGRIGQVDVSGYRLV